MRFPFLPAGARSLLPLPALLISACDPAPLACVPSGAADADTVPAGCGCNADPLQIEPSVRIDGEGSFGNYVAAAPDVDGDGFDDLAVAAYTTGYSNGHGAFHVFRGSAEGMEPTPWASVEGTTTWGNLGHSVAGLGDVDGDGFGDVAATWYSGSQRIGLWRGGPEGLAAMEEASASDGRNGDFTSLVVRGGDLDGDGLAEAVAARVDGSVVWLSGADGFTVEGELAVTDETPYVAGVGDVDGDGLDDVVAGGRQSDGTGLVQVALGSTTGLVAGTRLASGEPGDEFVAEVGGVGDLDGDGRADFAVVNHHTWDGDDDEQAHVYLGATGGAEEEPVGAWSTVLPYAIGGGDLDGDGYAELLLTRRDGDLAVAAVVACGGVGGPSEEGVVPLAVPGDASAYAGIAGDLNGDGRTDVWAASQYGYGEWVTVHPGRAGAGGAGCATGGGGWSAWPLVLLGLGLRRRGRLRGEAHRRRARWERARHGNSSIQYGAPMFLLLALPSLLAPRAFAEDLLTGPADSGFGHALAAGDWNGDGFADLAVGAPGVSAAWLYLGSEDGLAPGDTLGSTAEADEFGAAMTGCDLNGDSFTDLVVGAPQDASGDGGFYLWYGSMEGLSGGLFTTGEEGSAGQLGLALACAGDVDGDGFDDLLVGAPIADGAAGEVRVYRGSAAGLEPFPAQRLDGDGGGSKFGWSVAGIGDIDGDGYDDVAVGAPDSEDGAVWSYSGGVDGLEVSRTFVAYDGEAQAYGYAVAGAGDVDGDGTPELAVGNNPYTYGHDRAWVDGVELTPPVGGGGFGCVLASAGDVDADGYADLLVGAGGYLCLGSDTGNVGAWLYRGSADRVSEARDLSTPGQPATALQGVGDIDGDGDDDVAVGMGWDDTVTIHAGAPSDADGDGVENPAWGGNDCDDADAGLYPGATEVAGDGIDQDCDGVDASEDPDEPTPTPAAGDAACGCGGPVALTLPAVLVAGFFGTRRRQTAYREVVTTRTAVSG